MSNVPRLSFGVRLFLARLVALDLIHPRREVMGVFRYSVTMQVNAITKQVITVTIQVRGKLNTHRSPSTISSAAEGRLSRPQ